MPPPVLLPGAQGSQLLAPCPAAWLPLGQGWQAPGPTASRPLEKLPMPQGVQGAPPALLYCPLGQGTQASRELLPEALACLPRGQAVQATAAGCAA